MIIISSRFRLSFANDVKRHKQKLLSVYLLPADKLALPMTPHPTHDVVVVVTSSRLQLNNQGR